MSEAAAHCGYKSRTVLYRLQRDGLLRDYEVGRCGRSLLLESNPVGRCSLREHIAACVQLRFDSPLAQRPHRAAAAPPPLADLSDEQLAAYCDKHLGDEALAAAMAPINQWTDSQRAPDWEAISTLANASLDCSAWGPPPYSADQWATLAVVLELALEAAGGG